MIANGSCHSLEGIKLEELALRAGDAKLLVCAAVTHGCIRCRAACHARMWDPA